ncbi:hypothetical protein [Erwinia tasmaniensis]|uniref:hypothetical protein n=1 Tax=Erwinia tasmaniensis TaxID=338565 RepID=UPI0012FE9656|nr:hypothetical protein [Erwinia tasmaniensis]
MNYQLTSVTSESKEKIRLLRKAFLLSGIKAHPSLLRKCEATQAVNFTPDNRHPHHSLRIYLTAYNRLPSSGAISSSLIMN